jgi:hypothetical protein
MLICTAQKTNGTICSARNPNGVQQCQKCGEPFACYSCNIPLYALEKGEISLGGSDESAIREIANILQGIAKQYNLKFTRRPKPQG